MYSTEVVDLVKDPRIFASLVTLCMFVAGCGRPTAPSVAGRSPAVNWDHLSTESWRYELESPVRIANYSFLPHGIVLASIGTKHGDLHAVSGVAYHWYVDAAGDLILTDESRSMSCETFTLTDLTLSTATVRHGDTGLSEQYSRRYSR